jgi:hypothetical protein
VPEVPTVACACVTQRDFAQVKRDNPEASNTDTLKLLGEKWKAADAETKAKCAAAYSACKRFPKDRDAHAPHHAAIRIRRLGWSLRRACGGAWKNADGDGLLGRYETLYKENKAKYDEEMKTYKNSDSYKEFAAKPKESTGDRAPSFPTSAFPQPGLPDSPASTLWLPWATHADSPRWAARVIV